jgi:hypothetical protein
MKKSIYLGLIITLITGSCAQEKKSPIEGTWKLAYGKWTMYRQTFPDQIKGVSLRIYSNGYYVFSGHLEGDTISGSPSGAGSYTLNGDKFEELILSRSGKSRIGTKIKFLLEVRNDTLIQRWPVDENWKLAEEYNIEKYIRVE